MKHVSWAKKHKIAFLVYSFAEAITWLLGLGVRKHTMKLLIKSIIGVALLFAVLLLIRTATSDRNTPTQIDAAKLPINNSAATTALATTSPSQGAVKPAVMLNTAKEEDTFATETRRGINFAYDKAIQGLGLSQEEIHTLNEFLLERALAGKHAQAIVSDKGYTSKDDLPILVNVARGDVEREMRETFGEEKFARIKSMLDSTTHLLALRMEIDPALKKRSLPETQPKQALLLAAAMQQEYGSNNSSFATRAKDANRGTGLTASDVKVLERASAFLASPQLAVVAESFSERNRKLNSIAKQ